MSATIAACLNVFNDAAALRGALESASMWADNIFVIHSGPGGFESTDGTLDLLREFGIDPKFDDIQQGYGVIRSRLIHECGCDWAFILDADERFHPLLPILHCEGGATWSPGQPPHRDLRVTERDSVCDQGKLLRALINNPEFMAVRSIRRHWFDFTMRHPTQNWHHIPDHQLRIVRNVAEIGYQSHVKMHERIIDSRTGKEPHFADGGDYAGPFFDHYHVHFRLAHPGTKERNEDRYRRLEKGEPMIP